LRRGDLEWLSYGLIRHPLELTELRSSGYAEVERPVFFLSTGRCGTLFFTRLLERDRRLKLAHAPVPELVPQSTLAWEALGADPASASDHAALGEVFLAGREAHLLGCARAGRRWVETNNWITFFAPVIAEVLPQAVFVHLHRHPGEFVRSGIRRGYYRRHPYDAWRPRPSPGSEAALGWDEAGDIRRIGWLWDATNGFVERFAEGLSPQRFHTVSLNRLDEPTIRALAAFVGARLSDRWVRQLLDDPTRPNAQRSGRFPPHAEWSPAQRDQLRAASGERAARLGYAL
jgi:hypothetical protein